MPPVEKLNSFGKFAESKMAHLPNFDDVHQLYYLGLLEIPPILPPNNDGHSRSIEERIIDHVETAQLGGFLKDSQTY